MAKTAVVAGLSGMHKTGCSGEKSLVLHVPNSSSAGKRFDRCDSHLLQNKTKHTDPVKAYISKEAPSEEKPSGNRSEECCLTGWVCPVR